MKTRLEMLAIVAGITGVEMERLTLTGSRRYGQGICDFKPMEYNGKDVDIVIEWNGGSTEFDCIMTTTCAAQALVTNYAHYWNEQRPCITVNGAAVGEAYDESQSTVCAYGTIDGYQVNFIAVPTKKWEIWRFITDHIDACWTVYSSLPKQYYVNVFKNLREKMYADARIFFVQV